MTAWAISHHRRHLKSPESNAEAPKFPVAWLSEKDTRQQNLERGYVREFLCK